MYLDFEIDYLFNSLLYFLHIFETKPDNKRPFYCKYTHITKKFPKTFLEISEYQIRIVYSIVAIYSNEERILCV